MDSWEKNLEVIRDMMANQPFDQFLRWPIIQQTMFVGNNEYIAKEYKT